MPNRHSEFTADANGYSDARRTVWTQSEVFLQHDFPFGILHGNPQPPNEMHSHKGFWELVVVYKGSGIHCTEDGEYAVRAGDVFVIKGEQQHGYKNPRGLYLKNICFSPSHLLIQAKHVKKLPGYHVLFTLEPKFRRAHQFESRLQLAPEETSHVMALISLIEKELGGKLPGYEYTITAFFMQMVSFLCRCYAHTSRMRTHSLARMARVISFLETHYAEPVELADLQASAHMSSSALLRNFKEATGFSPIDYLLRVRISRAIELLRNEDATVTDTAFAVGFSDSNYFARQFKRLMKLSPSEYRARMQPPI
jgi:AraC-like DNA-binding protein/quercetin dioxygenase-like cupin family protein